MLTAAVLLMSASAGSEVLPGGSIAVWGIQSPKAAIPPGSIISDAVLTIHGVSPSSEQIAVYLLNNPEPGFRKKQKNSNSSLFSSYGTRLTGRIQGDDYICRLSRINDPASRLWSVFPYPFNFTLADDTVVRYTSALLELIDYAGTDDSFGFGIESPNDSVLTFLLLELTVTISSYQGDPAKITLVFKEASFEDQAYKAASEKGDFNGDGQVNLKDFAILAAKWHKVPENPTSDSTSSSTDSTDVQELLNLADNWLRK